MKKGIVFMTREPTIKMSERHIDERKLSCRPRHPRRAIYVRMPKAANTGLGNYCVHHGVETILPSWTLEGEMSSIYPADNDFLFSFIRHPVKRFKSAFQMFIRGHTHCRRLTLTGSCAEIKPYLDPCGPSIQKFCIFIQQKLDEMKCVDATGAWDINKLYRAVGVAPHFMKPPDLEARRRRGDCDMWWILQHIIPQVDMLQFFRSLELYEFIGTLDYLQPGLKQLREELRYLEPGNPGWMGTFGERPLGIKNRAPASEPIVLSTEDYQMISSMYERDIALYEMIMEKYQ